MNTFNLSGQQGTAAKMSYEYIVPSTKWPPVQGLPQNLQTIRAVQPSKQPMHTGVKKLDFPSNFTCKIKILFQFLKKIEFFKPYLNASPVMLSGREEKCSVDQWVPIINAHECVTQDTRHFVQLVTGQIGQDEDTGLIVANAAFILHFDVVRVDFLLRQNIEGAVIHSPRENAPSRIMPVNIIKRKSDTNPDEFFNKMKNTIQMFQKK